ncbi:RHS repeat-associated core domain-containing protein, partial [Vreelandella titanicae]|uniref:RHS repeat-associated core domain-containing protein n=1 Tax=Vreelandella titanicae TaxID=664683 RepID=UPI000888AC53
MLRIDDTEQGQVLSAYITDALGTPMQLVTTSGQPRWLAEPDDWAAVKNQRAVRNVTQPIRFQGQWHDEESGLYYNRHRYYDPQQGRYISQDPIGLNGGTNLYGYVTNPTGMVDPLGLFGANMHHLEPFGVGIHASNPSNTQSPAVAQPPSEWEFVEWEVLEPEGRLAWISHSTSASTALRLTPLNTYWLDLHRLLF